MGNCQPTLLIRRGSRASSSRKRVSDESFDEDPASECNESSPSFGTLSGKVASLSNLMSSPVVQPRLFSSKSLPFITDEGIHFQRISLEDARHESRSRNTPIFVVEVNDRDATDGRNALSHPLVVEAAETLFVCVQHRLRRTVVNNAGMRCLTVVRCLNQNGVDLVTPIHGDLLCIAKVASAMVEALQAMGLRAPTYLQLLEAEHSGRTCEGPSGVMRRTDRQAVFGMESFTRGEVEFAGLEGVLETLAGYHNHDQVVRVTYDSSRLSYCRLVQYALEHDRVNTLYFQSTEERVVGIIELKLANSKVNLTKLSGKILPSADPKHALRTTMLRFVPMTALQATRANRLVEMGAFNEAMHLLSPRQGKILMGSLQNSKRIDATDVTITVAWKRLVDAEATMATS